MSIWFSSVHLSSFVLTSSDDVSTSRFVSSEVVQSLALVLGAHFQKSCLVHMVFNEGEPSLVFSCAGIFLAQLWLDWSQGCMV